jgi:hypothetical protein
MSPDRESPHPPMLATRQFIARVRVSLFGRCMRVWALHAEIAQISVLTISSLF